MPCKIVVHRGLQRNMKFLLQIVKKLLGSALQGPHSLLAVSYDGCCCIRTGAPRITIVSYLLLPHCITIVSHSEKMGHQSTKQPSPPVCFFPGQINPLGGWCANTSIGFPP